jgi:hypothetical protein
MEDEKPPILGSWRNLYILVLIFQVFIVALGYYLTKTLS